MLECQTLSVNFIFRASERPYTVNITTKNISKYETHLDQLMEQYHNMNNRLIELDKEKKELEKKKKDLDFDITVETETELINYKK